MANPPKKQSLWLDTTTAPEFPPLSGEVTVDVVIVGAGITGITTAYLLKKAGCSVAVVDQQSVGGGETGHTTAHLTFVTDARLSELAKKLGRDQARAFWDAGREAMGQIVEIADAEKIECGLRVVPGYLFAALGRNAEDERAALEEDARLAEEFGYDEALLARDPIFERPAVRFANQMKFHPLEYLYPLHRCSGS